VEVEKRWSRHRNSLRKGEHHSIPLQRAWTKYGEDAFRFHILDYVEDAEELHTWEQQWMNSLNPEYNVNPNADGSLGRILSDNHKKKISSGLKEAYRMNPRPPVSKETGEKISKATKGKIAWNKGKPQTEEFKKDVSEGLKRYFASHPSVEKGTRGWYKKQ